MKTRRTIFFLPVFILACGPLPQDELTEIDPLTGKAEPWNYANDPSRMEVMGMTFLRNFHELFDHDVARMNPDGTPRLGEDGQPVMVNLQSAESDNKPWPASYWPMTDDGYNYRWLGSTVLSPMEKFDKVFNGWEPSEAFMKLRPFSRPGVEFDKDYYAKLGPAAKRAHSKGGNYRAVNHVRNPNDPEDDGWGGLESWFGHCHAWAPAAIEEPEPLHAVEVNGTTFEVSDIKALTMAQYEGIRSTFLGSRCNNKEVKRDEYGRILDEDGFDATACRDTNPGAFHVVMVNMLGRYGKSFVIDATYDYQVWNQPVLGYRIKEQRLIDNAKEAIELLPGDRPADQPYPFNDKAVSFVSVEVQFDYIVESSQSREPMTPHLSSYTRTNTYKYLLELDAKGNILGGEWLSNYSFPDFLWAPRGHGYDSTVPYTKVKDLLEKARQ